MANTSLGDLNLELSPDNFSTRLGPVSSIAQPLSILTFLLKRLELAWMERLATRPFRDAFFTFKNKTMLRKRMKMLGNKISSLTEQYSSPVNGCLTWSLISKLVELINKAVIRRPTRSCRLNLVDDHLSLREGKWSSTSLCRVIRVRVSGEVDPLSECKVHVVEHYDAQVACRKADQVQSQRFDGIFVTQKLIFKLRNGFLIIFETQRSMAITIITVVAIHASKLGIYMEIKSLEKIKPSFLV
ncbi:hypothetical protein BpHYR1_038297 [Brachionus plicatilis]|uniref:Uncharacterized protein n=1 Tax=Brachionus plicatilis TaxID=10195 RepID=A0A3M7SI82_BRAPC|nr:hypothetical protein BpHYR1_038297 [Brachionus plicatilis]